MTLRKKRSWRKKALSMTGTRSTRRPGSKMLLSLDREAESVSTRTWGSTNLCQIPYSVSNTLNTRSGNDCRISGFLHKVGMRNNTNLWLKYYEYWIIPRQWNSETYTDADLQNDFLVVHGAATDQDRTWTATLASIIYDEPINGKKFTVLKKKVTTLPPAAATATNAGSLRMLRTYKTWIPVNRTYNYGSFGEGETSNTPLEPPIFYINFVVDQLSATATPIQASAITRELHIVTYFRDGESGM